MKTHSAILAAALGAAMLSAPAFAGPAGVSYADLDLATPAGQAQLDRRIDKAAREMCGITDIRTGTLLQSTSSKECYQATKASARKQVAERIAREGAKRG